MRILFMINQLPSPTFKEPKKFSAIFNDFIAKCLIKNPEERFSAEELLNHPFISQVKQPDIVLKDLATRSLEIIEREGGWGDLMSKMESNTEYVNTLSIKKLGVFF